MKHYLNVCDVNGAEVEPVDVITFGSPCQDLSVAGKRAGLKHESNGDEETINSNIIPNTGDYMKIGSINGRVDYKIIDYNTNDITIQIVSGE